MYYTYLIGWFKLDRWYYGSKTGKDADPSTFCKEYFTSSKLVQDYRQYNGEPDIIQVRRTFDDRVKCLNWEKKVLRRLKVAKSERWLKQTDFYRNLAMLSVGWDVDLTKNRIGTPIRTSRTRAKKKAA